MILAVDVDYRNAEAVVAGVCFKAWADEKPDKIYYCTISEIEDYEPGEFYKREMPCILQLIREYSLTPNVIVIDGFVLLGEDSTPGLGMHLYYALGENIPIIGVAKKAFKGTSPKTEILRGKSLKPLFVTSIGMDFESAKSNILSMHGMHRIPTLLKQVDRVCRKS